MGPAVLSGGTLKVVSLVARPVPWHWWWFHYWAAVGDPPSQASRWDSLDRLLAGHSAEAVDLVTPPYVPGACWRYPHAQGAASAGGGDLVRLDHVAGAGPPRPGVRWRGGQEAFCPYTSESDCLHPGTPMSD